MMFFPRLNIFLIVAQRKNEENNFNNFLQNIIKSNFNNLLNNIIPSFGNDFLKE